MFGIKIQEKSNAFITTYRSHTSACNNIKEQKKDTTTKIKQH